MINYSKYHFDHLLHEVLRDVTTLRKVKGSHPEYVDDYVLQQLDEIKLLINKIVGESL